MIVAYWMIVIILGLALTLALGETVVELWKSERWREN